MFLSAAPGHHAGGMFKSPEVISCACQAGSVTDPPLQESCSSRARPFFWIKADSWAS